MTSSSFFWSHHAALASRMPTHSLLWKVTRLLKRIKIGAVVKISRNQKPNQTSSANLNIAQPRVGIVMQILLGTPLCMHSTTLIFPIYVHSHPSHESHHLHPLALSI